MKLAECLQMCSSLRFLIAICSLRKLDNWIWLTIYIKDQKILTVEKVLLHTEKMNK